MIVRTGGRNETGPPPTQMAKRFHRGVWHKPTSAQTLGERHPFCRWLFVPLDPVGGKHETASLQHSCGAPPVISTQCDRGNRQACIYTVSHFNVPHLEPT